MVNKELLKEAIKESGIKKNYIADKLGMTTTGFAKKLDSDADFKLTEARILCDVLNLTNSQKNSIFFADWVVSKATKGV